MAERDLTEKETNVEKMKTQRILSRQEAEVEKQQTVGKDEIEVSPAVSDKLQKESGAEVIAVYVKDGKKVHKLKKPKGSK